MSTTKAARGDSATTIVIMALGALFTASVGSVFPLALWWPLILGAACGVTSFLHGRHVEAPAAGVFQFCAWQVGAGWVAWTFTHGLWHPNSYASFSVILCVLLTVNHVLPMPLQAASAVGREQAMLALPPGIAPVEPVRAPEQDELEKHWLVATKKKGCEVTLYKPWVDGNGYSFELRLPGEGETTSDMQSFAGALATRLDLPDGCNVEILPGRSRRYLDVEVATRNQMETPRDYLLVPGSGRPALIDRVTPLSVNDDLPFGWHANGSVAAGSVRQSCLLLVGEPRSGKTNTEEAFNSSLVRCPDVFIGMIDLNGGGMPLRWIMPWLDGLCAEPAIGWPATSIPEATLLTRWAVEVMHERKRAYQRLMARILGRWPQAFAAVYDDGAWTVYEVTIPGGGRRTG